MTILDEIITDKKIEVALRKQLFPVSYWEASPLFGRTTSSLAAALQASQSWNTNSRCGYMETMERY